MVSVDPVTDSLINGVAGCHSCVLLIYLILGVICVLRLLYAMPVPLWRVDLSVVAAVDALWFPPGVGLCLSSWYVQ